MPNPSRYTIPSKWLVHLVVETSNLNINLKTPVFLKKSGLFYSILLIFAIFGSEMPPTPVLSIFCINLNMEVYRGLPENKLAIFLSRKAEGRGQEAEGILASVLCRDHSPKGFPQGREQGFKTPTKFSIWWLLFRRGRNPLLNKTFCPLPPASCLLQ
ncbi:hypothetical protein Nos7524_5373 [Nostoc sp. PCC 7524]|nr:hypothetical protein Nos7524_5373 [Nostoc sp. PCC 7524]